MTDSLKAQDAPEEEVSEISAAAAAGNLPAAIRQFLHQALRDAHDAALEQMAEEDSAALDAPKPVRAAVYRSVRRLRLEEDNLRYRTVESLVESVCSSLSSTATKGESTKKLLSLMNEEELEDSVLIMSLAAASDAHCAFLRRAFVDALCKKLQLTDPASVENTLSPRRFLEHYFEHAKPLELEPELRIALLESFELYVLRRLPALYEVMANHLGVEVQVAGFRQAGSAGGVGAGGAGGRAGGAGGAGGDAAGGPPGLPAWTETVGNEVVTSLLEALASRARSSRSSTAPEWPRDRVLACLSRLQGNLSNCVSDHTLSSGGLAANVEAELRRVFSEDANAMSRNISDVDTAVADLVDMIFDYVVDSQADLPKERQVPLGTLRIPYYRVALLDRQLFIKREHPARRLLERLPTYGIPNDAASPEEVPQMSLIALVQKIHREFDGSMEVFERLFKELDRTQRTVDSRLRMAERRVVQHAEGRERLAHAWQESVTLVRNLLAEHSPPRLIRDMLERPWAQYMVLALLKPDKRRHGGMDPKEVALELCRVPSNRDGSNAAAQAPRHLSMLAKELKHGLTQVGYSDEDVVTLWRDIVSVLVTNAHKSSSRVQRFDSIKPIGHSIDSADRELLRGIGFGAKPDAGTGDATVAANDMPANDTPSEASKVAATAALPRVLVAPSESKKLEGAALGEWYSEARVGSDPAHHKLVWFGKFIDRYLFVDRSGRKTIECAGSELKEMLSSGRLAPVALAPPVEVAIMSIFDRVNHEGLPQKVQAA